LEIKAIISTYQCLSTTTSPFIIARAILEDITKVLFQASTTNLQTKSQPMSLFLYLTLGQLHGSKYLSVRCFCSNIHSPLLLLMLNSESLGSPRHPVKGTRLPRRSNNLRVDRISRNTAPNLSFSMTHNRQRSQITPTIRRDLLLKGRPDQCMRWSGQELMA
jgi:hypothetical protein